METLSITIAAIALGCSLVSLVMAALAFYRAASVRDVQLLRARQRLLADELERRVRAGYEESLSQTKRARQRLTELREDATATLRERIDAMNRQLAEIQVEIEASLVQLTAEAAAGALAAQKAVAKKVRRVQGRLQLLIAEIDMVRAERLAEGGEFVRAERLLEDAVAKVREVRMRLADGIGDDPRFAEVLESLYDAIESVQVEAKDHRSRIDRVVAASEALIASLESVERTT